MAGLLDLYITFAKVGVMTFGGGVAMLPILQREVVQNKHWATEEEMTDYYAIGQCTPGIIAVNVATFIGSKERGVLGGIFATLGIVFPSIVIISALAGLIARFSDFRVLQDAFAGIRVCVCVLVFNSALKLVKKALIDWKTAVLYACVLAAALFTNLNPAIFVLVAAVAGIILKSVEAGKR